MNNEESIIDPSTLNEKNIIDPSTLIKFEKEGPFSIFAVEKKNSSTETEIILNIVQYIRKDLLSKEIQEMINKEMK